jgi:hypothetical protein
VFNRYASVVGYGKQFTNSSDVRMIKFYLQQYNGNRQATLDKILNNVIEHNYFKVAKLVISLGSRLNTTNG